MTEEEIIAILDSYEELSLSTRTTDLSRERAKALDYYNMQPYGDEKKTSSKVVTSEVFDAVESTLTMLVKIFTSTDKAVEFIPEGPEDEQGADQKTKYANFIFYRENNGFEVIYNTIKDGLIMKNGIIKVYPKVNNVPMYYKYSGLTEGQALQLVSSGEEVIAGSSSQDFDGTPLYDLETKYVDKRTKICIESIPPEDFYVSGWHQSVLLKDADFVCHRSKVSATYLREVGLIGEDEDITNLRYSGYDEDDWSDEALSRDEDHNEQRLFRETDPLQKQMWRIVVKDIIARIDIDGDNIAERRRIIRIGNTIRLNEPCDYCPYGVFAPIMMPHRFIGKSYADLMMYWQRVQSTLLRQAIDNVYLTNQQRPIVKTSGITPMVDIDSLLTSGPGQPIYEKESGALRYEAPSFAATDILGVSEVVRQAGEIRTGISRISQGINPDAITKTAAGAAILTENANERTELLARVFAETCLKPVFAAIAHLIRVYQNRKKVIRIYNKFVEMDPSTWSESFDMSINVGLGSGTSRQTTANMADLLERQSTIVQGGGLGTLITPQNIYQTLTRYVETLGFKDASPFFTDPSTVQPPQPQPTEQDKLVKAQMEIEQLKAQNERLKIALDARAKDESNETDIAKAVLDARVKLEIERIRSGSKGSEDGNQGEYLRTILNDYPLEAFIKDGIATGHLDGEHFRIDLTPEMGSE